MNAPLPMVAGVILVVCALFLLWEAQQARGQGQWLGKALFAICFLCLGSASLLVGSDSTLSGLLSIAGAVVAGLAAYRLRSERHR